ncbi:MAG TPA: methyltransferase domain-containing protein [bacterium]|nr:methyltransferase domain-containing protein [bacterium]
MAVVFGKDTFIVCRNSQGTEIRATSLRLTRYLVVFEVYNPYSILQLSEVLTEFRIFMNEKPVYSGRAVVSNLVNTGIFLVCEASLEDAWLDVDLFSPVQKAESLESEFGKFLKEWEKVQVVTPDFKVAIADMQTLLVDLRHWLEQVEFGIRSEPTGDRLQREREVVERLKEPFFMRVAELGERFEAIANTIPEDLQPTHRAYGRRQIHPLILCAPFLYRTFQKPLGYAGDYEMVRMILRDPLEGTSLFAKMINFYFWNIAPAEAHRNRIKYLTERLREETRRGAALGRSTRIFNLGCGPAQEVLNFLTQDDVCERANLTLLDFNDETLSATQQSIESVRSRFNRRTPVNLVKKSVNQILKETMRPEERTMGSNFDMIYCAGLFDYFSDKICKRLMNQFYEMLAPGGLLVATNVDSSNPARQQMEYFMEWHLVYRNAAQLGALAPEKAVDHQVKADSTGVNIFIEVRRPENG